MELLSAQTPKCRKQAQAAKHQGPSGGFGNYDNTHRTRQPRHKRGIHRKTRGRVFANRVVSVVRYKQVRPEHRNALRIMQSAYERGIHDSPRCSIFTNGSIDSVRNENI